MAVLRLFRTALRIVTETPVLVTFTLAFGLIGALSSASNPAGTVDSFLQLLATSTLTGAFYTVADDARLGSDTDLRTSTMTQYYYVSLLDATLLTGLIVFVVVMIVGGSVFDYVKSDRLNTMLNDSASFTPAELATSRVAPVILAAVIYVSVFFSTAVVLDGQTAGGSLSKSVGFVLSNLRAVVGYVVVATVVASVVDPPVLWFVTLDGATAVADAVTAFQASIPTIGIAVVTIGSTVAILVGRTYEICFYRVCMDIAPEADPESDDDE